jgi:zinc protease
VIRESRGLNYGDYSYIEAFPEGGQRRTPPPNVGRRQQLFEVWIRTLRNDKALFALRAAMREFQDLVDHGMTQEEFDLTRDFLTKYSLHFAETTSSRLGYAIDDQFYGMSQSHPRELPQDDGAADARRCQRRDPEASADQEPQDRHGDRRSGCDGEGHGRRHADSDHL